VVKLYLHRAEARLLHYLTAVAVEDSPPVDLPPPVAMDRNALAHLWRTRLETWFSRHHLDSSYRRLDSVLDHDQEAMTADIITDLTLLAEVAQQTSDAVASLDLAGDTAGLEEVAFYRVISPWRTHGQATLCDVLRWLSETLREQEEW
jgi:hypothetical protein